MTKRIVEKRDRPCLLVCLSVCRLLLVFLISFLSVGLAAQSESRPSGRVGCVQSH